MENRKPLHEQHVRHADTDQLKEDIFQYITDFINVTKAYRDQLKPKLTLRDTDPIYKNLTTSILNLESLQARVKFAHNKDTLRTLVSKLGLLRKEMIPIFLESQEKIKKYEATPKKKSDYASVTEVLRLANITPPTPYDSVDKVVNEVKFLKEKDDMTNHLQELRTRTESLKNKLLTPHTRGKNIPIARAQHLANIKREFSDAIHKLNDYDTKLSKINDRQSLDQFKQDMVGFRNELTNTFKKATELSRQKSFRKEFYSEQQQVEKHDKHPPSHTKTHTHRRNK